MAPAQKDNTLRTLQAEAYLSVLRAVAASELDWVRTFDTKSGQGGENGTRCIIVFFPFAADRRLPTALTSEHFCRTSRALSAL